MKFNLPSTVYLPPELDGKAKNLHARMAIFFDNNIYKEPEDRNDTLLYTYLYHIIMMLAKKESYFKTLKDYEDFSCYMATKLYLRYINPEHTKKHGKIKSVLNYCKALLHHTKVDYQRDSFNEIIGVDNKGNYDGTSDALKIQLEESIQQSYCDNNSLLEAINDELDNIPDAIKKAVRESHYKEGTSMFHRLYISTLLSFLNCSTLCNSSIKKLQNREERGYDNDKFMLDLYKKEAENCIILWRLDNKYYRLVHLLTHKARVKFAQRIINTRESLKMTPDELSAVMMSAYGNTLRDDNEEI